MNYLKSILSISIILSSISTKALAWGSDQSRESRYGLSRTSQNFGGNIFRNPSPSDVTHVDIMTLYRSTKQESRWFNGIVVSLWGDGESENELKSGLFDDQSVETNTTLFKGMLNYQALDRLALGLNYGVGLVTLKTEDHTRSFNRILFGLNAIYDFQDSWGMTLAIDYFVPEEERINKVNQNFYLTTVSIGIQYRVERDKG